MRRCSVYPVDVVQTVRVLPKLVSFIAFLSLLICGQDRSGAQTWTPLTRGTPFQASQPLLLTDGSVLCQDYFTPDWYRLVPDQFGSYINGKWIKAASMQSDYG